MSLWKMVTLAVGSASLIWIAFLRAVVQQTREQYPTESFLEPMHWMNATFLALNLENIILIMRKSITMPS